MLQIKDVEVHAGARPLLSPVSFQVAVRDRIGLIDCSGAGKTTPTRILAGEGLPATGTVIRSGRLGYLPQDPRSEEPEQLARDRILGTRGLGQVMARLRRAEQEMSSSQGTEREKTMAIYARAKNALLSMEGYATEAEAARIAANLGLPDRVLGQPLYTLSGGQRRQIELARILLSGADTLLLDEPTNHLDADSVTWLRGYLQSFGGGLVAISYDVGLLEAVANKVLHLDANHAEPDFYAMDWERCLQQREIDGKRRGRERLNMERKASQLMAQVDRMRTKATKAVAAQNTARRARKLLPGIEGEREHDEVARIRFPKPAPCGKTPLLARDLLKTYSSLEVFTAVDLAIDKGSKVVILGLNGAGKAAMLRLLTGLEEPDAGQRILGRGARLGYYAQEYETLDASRFVLEGMISASPDLGGVGVCKVLGSFPLIEDSVDKPAKILSGGEEARLALIMLVVSTANVLLLDEPTNNLDPASRAEVLSALRSYSGAVILVTYDPGAIEALEPDRVLVLPDGVEDLQSDDYVDLIALT